MTSSLAYPAAGTGHADWIMLERAFLSPLVELAKSVAPSLRVELEPSFLLRAVVHLPASVSDAPKAVPDASTVKAAIAAARQILKLRRKRELMLGADLFGEPAWDLVLDLFIAQADGRQVSISSACLAASVPQTTALRWTRELERRGLLIRRDDPSDGRRAYVTLSADLYASLIELLGAA